MATNNCRGGESKLHLDHRYVRLPPNVRVGISEKYYPEVPYAMVRTPYPLNRTFRFGEFEFSVRAGELCRKRGGPPTPIPAVPRPRVLLKCAGEVVTREEIRQQVWQDDDIRDCDNSLRVAVAKLRQALGETPTTRDTSKLCLAGATVGCIQ